MGDPIFTSISRWFRSDGDVTKLGENAVVFCGLLWRTAPFSHLSQSAGDSGLTLASFSGGKNYTVQYSNNYNVKGHGESKRFLST